ncbi:porin [Acidithiobacillus thiooxidans]|uniref:porin n=1 Tax=Acidithiobacillus thiooxidans TaxID=930 RepID=UPI0035652025
MNDAKAGIYGGRGNNITAGVNWYANEHVRLMLDYSHAHIGDIPTSVPTGASFVNSPYGGPLCQDNNQPSLRG